MKHLVHLRIDICIVNSKMCVLFLNLIYNSQMFATSCIEPYRMKMIFLLNIKSIHKTFRLSYCLVLYKQARQNVKYFKMIITSPLILQAAERLNIFTFCQKWLSSWVHRKSKATALKQISRSIPQNQERICQDTSAWNISFCHHKWFNAFFLADLYTCICETFLLCTLRSKSVLNSILKLHPL
jgi:hypothetical protein